MVRKAVFVALALIALIFTISIISAGISKSGVNIKKAYTSGQAIEGSFNISLSSYPIDSLVKLELTDKDGVKIGTQSFPLKDFLEKNNISYTCSPANCLSQFEIGNQSTSETVNAPEGRYIAFAVTKKVSNVKINDLSFYMVGEPTTPGCEGTPLEITLLDDLYASWKYLVAGSGYCTVLPKYNDAYNSLGDADHICGLSSGVYCEKISMPAAERFRLTANVKRGNDVKTTLLMSIGNNGYNEKAQCALNLSEINIDSTGEISCTVNFTAIESREYSVCIKGDEAGNSDHFIKCETSDPYAGFTSASTEIDFGLAAQASDFKSFDTTESFSKDYFDDETYLAKHIQDYINLKYNAKCNLTAPCVIPIKIVSTQNIIFSNADLSYESGGVTFHEDLIYNATREQATFTASGKAFLEKAIVNDEKVFFAPVKYGSYDYVLSIGTDVIDSGTLRVEKLPTIKVTPQNFSAGIPVRFSLITENATSYSWDFGDTSKTTTTIPFAEHTYSKVGIYNLVVSMVWRGMNLSNNFTVSAMSPKDAVNSTLLQKISRLSKMQTDMESLGIYKSIAESQIDLSGISNNLQYVQSKLADPTSDFVDLLNKVTAIMVFKGIKSEDIGAAPLSQSVDLDLLSDAGAGTISDRTKLDEEITKWQGLIDVKAKATVKTAESEVASENKDLLTIMTVEATPSQDLGKVFFIIKNIENAKFPDNSSKVIGGARVFVFNDFSSKRTIEFAVPGRKSPADLDIVTSPEFSKFVVGDFYCGNTICEEDLGEDFETCPDDCKAPVITTGRIITALIVLLVVAGILYWIWRYYVHIYEKKLEEKLFRNKADLYNLTYFIGKAMNKNEKPEDIRKKLVDAKWNPEQVDYALSKISRERKQVQLSTLKNFIKNELRQNKAEELIKNSLKDAGWNIKDIDYAYKKTLKEIEDEKKAMLKQAEKAKKAQQSMQPKSFGFPK